ncbi:hypothetical protein [Streptomyces collinus]|uniref:hypothetical protein n=1 Tax=Streptomyces collinus TaxID=42684 RepID=UPI00369C2FA9
MDELREEADRMQAELALAERDWKEWAIARSRVGEVLDPVKASSSGRTWVHSASVMSEGYRRTRSG